MNIIVDLNYPIKDGAEVVFRSPVDCSQVTGLIVYYPESGVTASKEFAFADAHGNNVGDIDHLFAENVVVKVILDVTTGMAFVQNADTNAYLEGRFKELEGMIGSGGGGSGGTVTDANINDLIEAATEERFTTLEEQVADLLYKAIDITGISNNVGTQEMGKTITSVTISWTMNKKPASQTLDGESLDVAVRSKAYTGLSISTNKSFTLSVTDERGAVDSASTSISFLNGVYYGVLEDGATINSATVLALTRNLLGSRGITFTANAGATQRIAYAFPSRYGTPTFNVGGFEGGFSKASTISFKNASGYTENYDVWLSDNVNLGSTTVKVS